MYDFGSILLGLHAIVTNNRDNWGYLYSSARGEAHEFRKTNYCKVLLGMLLGRHYKWGRVMLSQIEESLVLNEELRKDEKCFDWASLYRGL